MKTWTLLCSCWLTLGSAIGGCGDDQLKANKRAAPETSDPCQPTRYLQASPGRLARGADRNLTVRWGVSRALQPPVGATLSIGPVEVDVPMLPGDPDELVGTVLNPFGAGAPVGSVEVLAAAPVLEGCAHPPSATTSFALE